MNRARKLLFLASLIMLLAPLMFASATNVYITPNGSAQGSCTSNPQTPAWFNNGANWGGGASQIGPGTTVLLCGTVTTPITFQGSGSSGSPVTLTFDTGAKISLGVCPSSGCLNLAYQSWIVVDGGKTCGWVNQELVACNGTIIPTASGTAYGNGGTSSFTVVADGCGNCEIRNLEVATYVHTSASDSPGGDMRGVQNLQAVSGGAFYYVHNMIVHDAASGIVFVPSGNPVSNFAFYNNAEYSVNSGVDVSNNNNGTITGGSVHDNHIYNTGVWDTSGCAFHHNSMHSFAYTQTNSGIQFYDNQMDGNWGGCPTSELFYEGSGSLNNNCIVFNNIFAGTYQQENNGVVSITCGGTLQFYNNTIVGDDQSGDVCLSLNLSNGGTAQVKNNIITNCNQLWETNSSAGAWGSGFDRNTWGGTSSGSPWAYSCGSGGCSYANSLSAWQSVCSCDSHSTFGASTSYVGVNSNGTPQSTSPAIGTGANLSDLGMAPLDSDITGAERPGGSTAWTGGAYSYGSASSSPNPPSGLTADVE